MRALRSGQRRLAPGHPATRYRTHQRAKAIRPGTADTVVGIVPAAPSSAGASSPGSWLSLAQPLPLLAAVGLFVYWGSAGGGYFPHHWYTGGLLFGAMMLVALVGRPELLAGLSRPTLVALAALAGFAGWSFLSIAWADVQGDAWLGAGRTGLYLLVFALFTIWRVTAERGARPARRVRARRRAGERGHPRRGGAARTTRAPTSSAPASSSRWATSTATRRSPCSRSGPRSSSRRDGSCRSSCARSSSRPPASSSSWRSCRRAAAPCSRSPSLRSRTSCWCPAACARRSMRCPSPWRWPCRPSRCSTSAPRRPEPGSASASGTAATVVAASALALFLCGLALAVADRRLEFSARTQRLSARALAGVRRDGRRRRPRRDRRVGRRRRARAHRLGPAERTPAASSAGERPSHRRAAIEPSRPVARRAGRVPRSSAGRHRQRELRRALRRRPPSRGGDSLSAQLSDRRPRPRQGSSARR